MELQKQFRRLVGSTIAFKTSDAAYEGIIHFVTRQVVIFQHAYIIPDRRFKENLIVSYKDIESYNVVDCTKLANIAKGEKLESLSVESNFPEIDFSRTMEYGREDEYILKMPPDLTSKLPNDYLILNDVNLEFHQAVDYIACQSTVGVSLHGAKISRSGQLSSISVCTPLCVFLFDIKMLGQKAFDEGLRDIFQSKDIKKVMHDSRQPADCLTHLFSTDLTNVFDTQVADYIVNMQMYGDKTFIKKVNSLDHCLINYLKIPKEFLYNQNNYLSYELEVNFFDRRPISNAYLNIAIKSTLYLLLLKQNLAELMLNPFQRAVDSYLKVFTDMCEAELVLESADSDEIAPNILTHNLQKIKYQDVPAETNTNPFMCNFKHPQTGAVIELKKESKRDPNNFISNSLNDNDLEKCTMPTSECITGILGTICSPTSENVIDVKRPNATFNSYGQVSDSSNNDVNLQNSYKLLSKTALDIGEKSTTNVGKTLSQLHETPKCLSGISENSLNSSKICFVPSGMGC